MSFLNVVDSILKKSLLIMFNKTKRLLKIPEIMQNVNVSMIPKPGKKIYTVFQIRGAYS